MVRSRVLFVRSSLPGGASSSPPRPPPATTSPASPAAAADGAFRDSVKLLFDSFNQMLAQDGRQVRATQVVFLRNLGSVLPHLLALVPSADLADLVSLLLGTVSEGPACADHPELGSAALAALREAAAAFAGDPRARARLLPTWLFVLNKFLARGGPALERAAADALGDELILLHRARRAGEGRYSEEVLLVAKAVLLPLIEALGRAADDGSRVGF